MKKYAWLALIGFLGALLAACSGPQATVPRGYEPKPRVLTATGIAPQSPPEVVVFAVSGRCGVPCDTAPDGNYDYLGPRGTAEAVAQAFRDLGKRALTLTYSAHLFNHTSPISGRYEYGFLQLEADVRWVRQNWPGTRLVLLGHSHGTNWTHDLLRAHPDWRFAYLIDLDGICTLWEGDNQPYFDRFYRTYGNPWGVDLSKSCDIEPIKKHWWWTSYYSAKDVAYPGAFYNLEVQSARLLAARVEIQGNTSLVFDYTDNVRLDASRSRIWTHVAKEDHSGITYPGSDALAWVTRQIRYLGLPY